MTEKPLSREERFLDRVERRSSFLKTMLAAEMGVYLPPDPIQRRKAIDHLVRLIARQSELKYLTPAAFNRAAEIILEHLEAMQRVLPHDVQYENRLKKTW